MKRRLLVVATLFCAPVWAVDLEMGIGMTEFGNRGDGTWYQEAYGPYKLKTSSPSASLGLTGRAYGLRWRAGLQYLGRYSTQCDCTSSDVAYEMLRDQHIDLGWPASDFRTKGDGYGAYASVLPEWNFAGKWAAFGELGVGYYGVSNKVTVYDWRPAINAEQTQWGEPQLLQVDNGRKWRFTPVYGIGVRYGNTSISLSTRKLSGEGPWQPVAGEKPWTVEIRHAF